MKEPTLAEVRAFVAEKGYHFSADKFWHHYDGIGWVRPVGKALVHIQRWKSVAWEWELREPGYAVAQNEKSTACAIAVEKSVEKLLNSEGKGDGGWYEIMVVPGVGAPTSR